MSFNATKYDIENWLRLENANILQKQCDVFSPDGLLVEQFKTRVNIKPVGERQPDGRLSVSAPSLWRSFTYDEAGNVIASLPEMREWTQACEDAAQGIPPDDNPDVIVNIPKSVVKYEEANVSSVPIGSTVSVYTKQLQPDEKLYLRHVMVSGDCIAKFQVFIDGQPLATKRTWWTKWNEDFWFNTSNGGIIYQSEELIEVKVTNNGEHLGDFEVSVGTV